MFGGIVNQATCFTCGVLLAHIIAHTNICNKQTVDYLNLLTTVSTCFAMPSFKAQLAGASTAIDVRLVVVHHAVGAMPCRVC